MSTGVGQYQKKHSPTHTHPDQPATKKWKKEKRKSKTVVTVCHSVAVVVNNNKRSKNFDEGPRCPPLVIPAAGESILKPLIAVDAPSPADESVAPCMNSTIERLQHLLLTQSNAFQWGATPKVAPSPNTWFLGPTQVNPNSMLVQPCL